MGGKIFAFIDSQNLNLSVKNDIHHNGVLIYKGWILNFKKLFFYLKTKYHTSNVFLFIGKVAGNESLYKNLSSIGYKIVFKPTLQYLDGNKVQQIKGNVDAELVLHTMIEFNNFDQAIIISGDGDYFCLIEYLEKKGKLLHVMIPNKYSFSSLLRPFSKFLVYITDLESNLK